jgi:putative ABC transport system substrate-binding protein
VIGRRQFITLLGSAAASLPLAARAQQPAVPLVGYLGSRSPESDAGFVEAVKKGLAETGFVEGRNLAIEFRWGESNDAKLAGLAGDLVRRGVAVIVAAAGPATQAAKEATTAVPIVFSTGADPVSSRFVASLNRPGGNLTGVTTFANQLGTKQFGLLQELVPPPAVVGYLHDSGARFSAESEAVETAARAFGRARLMLKAGSEREIDAAFVGFAERHVGGILVDASSFFATRLHQIVVLANHYAIPAVYPRREFVTAGGLLSYGTSFSDAYRLTGVYAGRILKGEKPADLPVLQPTKFELVINLRTAKTLGFTVPTNLLAIADEVIE